MTALPRRSLGGRARWSVVPLVVGLVALLAPPAQAQSGTVSVDDPTISEGDAGVSQVAFKITLTRGADPGAIVVDYVTQQGTATRDVDYLHKVGSVIFFDGETEKEVRVDVVGDLLDEDDEKFTLNLSGDPEVAFAKAVGEATIEDDDASPTLSITNASVDEGDAGTNDALFVVSLSARSGRTVKVDFATADDTATAPADYATRTGTLEFSPGELSEVVAVPVVGDTLSEDNEQFTVTLSNISNASFVGGGPTAEAAGTIVDDDLQPTVSIDDVRVLESAGTASFRVSLSAPSGREVKVTATTSDGTAQSGSDYGSTSDSDLTIPEGEDSTSFVVPIVDDSVPEGEEFFVVNLTNPQFALPGRTTATGVIVDDDKPAISISALVEKAEGTTVPPALGGPFTFEVKLSKASSETITVRYDTVDGTATADDDYAGVANGLVTFLPQQTSQSVTITVVPDGFAEGNETFSVKLKNPSDNAVLAEGASTGTGRILNDDGPPAAITIADITLAEGTGGTGTPANFTVQLDRPAPRTVTVNFATRNGSAVSPDDYTPVLAGTVTIAEGQSSGTASVRVEPDDIDEIDEKFDVVFSDPRNAVFAAGEDGVATATLTNDDTPPVVAIESQLSIPEGNSGSSGRNIDVTLSRRSGKTVTVAFTTAPGTAESGKDYSPPPNGTLTFAPGETLKRLRVVVNGDVIDEIDETFTVTLSPNPENATLGNATATVTIVDDDLAPLMSIANAEVVEPAFGEQAEITFAVSLSEESGKEVMVAVQTSDDTAFKGTNYNELIDLNFPIPPGSRGALITVVVLGDGADTTDLVFKVNLTNPREARFPPLTDTLTATGTILDADGQPSLSVRDATVNEGSGRVVMTVNLLPAAGSQVTVNYQTQPGSAVSPADFAAVPPTTLTFAAGQTSKTFTVDIVDDSEDEVDEDFSVKLSAATDPPATIGRDTGTVTIIDDDFQEISVADTSLFEGDSGTRKAQFDVSLSAPSKKTVTVAYATSDGTATSSGPAKDFTAVSGTLTFAPGETVMNVFVDVVGDELDEGDEQFTLGLAGPTNATIGQGVGVATIRDDDGPRVMVSGNSQTVADLDIVEGDFGLKLAVFTIRLDRPPVREVSLAYDTAARTARAGVDYLSTEGRVVFGPGQTERQVAVPVVGDSLPEVDETFRLGLSDPVGVQLGALEAIGTILNDDKPGYFMAATDGGIFSFGDAGFYGSTGAIRLNQPIVGAAAHPSGRGYWLVAADGGIFSFGEARFHGSTGAIKLNQPIVGMAATPSGQGYWLVATDGGIFAFGDARFHGSTGAIKLNKPIVGMASTPSGQGYWLVATDGGIFAFGDAKFRGSTGALTLNRPIVGMASTAGGNGYWLVATDGGIFAFGDAKFLGSTGALKLNRPVVGMASTPSGQGYWLVADDGGIFTFGDAEFLGSTGSLKLNRPVVGMAVL